jgi:hypothetical protein
VLLYFTSPCQIPVTVSITPAYDDDGDGCFVPNPFAPPLCAPTSFVINDSGMLNQCVQYDFPIASACCVSGKVFLNITFDQGTCPVSRPIFCGPTGGAGCTTCRQYNFFPGAEAPGEDMCLVLGPNQGGVDMWVDSECCHITPTVPGSWGTLKTIYR